MRILFDAHHLGSEETGIRRYSVNLIFNLKRFYSSEIELILYSNTPKERLPREFQSFEIYTPRFKNGLYRILHGFSEAIEKTNPDIIHVHNFSPVRKKLPTVNTVHDLCFKLNHQWFSLKSNLAFLFFLGKSIELSDYIICPSSIVKKKLKKFYNVKENQKIKVIHHGNVEEIFFYIKNKKKVFNYLKKKFNLEEEFILVVGNIEKRKQPELIIKSFKELRKRIEKISLVFVGPNKMKIKQERDIKILNYVSDRDLNFLYNGALCLVYFSQCEGFGLPIIEAFSTRLPIILNSIQPLNEIGGNAVLYSNDFKDLSLKLEKIALDRNLRAKYSKLSFERSRKFSGKTMAMKTLNLYFSLYKKYSKKQKT
ncbi:MAG: glycosyltransferase family 4 protein [Patescibacteria group bacterium]|nr:glycosyltransferase family 4 protein [Patescibacteria group bacterium]